MCGCVTGCVHAWACTWVRAWVCAWVRGWVGWWVDGCVGRCMRGCVGWGEWVRAWVGMQGWLRGFVRGWVRGWVRGSVRGWVGAWAGGCMGACVRACMRCSGARYGAVQCGAMSGKGLTRFTLCDQCLFRLFVVSVTGHNASLFACAWLCRWHASHRTWSALYWWSW